MVRAGPAAPPAPAAPRKQGVRRSTSSRYVSHTATKSLGLPSAASYPCKTGHGDGRRMRRLKECVRQKESRRFFIVVLGGKMVGVGLALLAAKFIAGFLGSPAAAQDGSTVPQESVINATNTMWTLIAAFLVFFMQAGFMM